MFLFNSNHGNDPISFPDHPFFHFPSPLDDEALLLQQPQHDIFHHQQQPLGHETPATFVNMVDSDSNRINVADVHHDNLREQQIQRKRSSSKRDRHSKINTLRGPRDRRMRLSLPVARDFFGLQDMLGVDKASKTVEWLLFQARHAIKKLSRDQQSCHNGSSSAARSASSISDSEVVSGIDETVVENSNKQGGRKATTKEKRGGRITRKTAFHPLARECRERARARAKARTREKQLQISRKLLSEAKSIDQAEARKQDLSKISSLWSTQIETGGEESAGTQINEDQPISSHPRAEQLGATDEGIFDDQDDSLMIMERWNPSNSIYQSLHNTNGIPQEHPFGDFQFFGKPWEAYNNHGIC